MTTSTTTRTALLASIASVAIALFAHGEAKAQVTTAPRLQQFGTVETVGGYTFFNDKATFWAVTVGSSIRGGYVQVVRTFRGGAPGPRTLTMNGTLTAREAYDLWLGLYNAAPWRAAVSAADFQNVDLPDTVVAYFGVYKQTIKASYPSLAAVPAGTPRVTAAMKRFVDLAWAEARQCTEASLFKYHAQGGQLGFVRDIEIRNDGQITDKVTYARIIGTNQPYDKMGNLTPADMADLKRLCAGWASYPARFAGNPSFVDGIDITTTYSTWGAPKAVFAGSAGSRPASYQAVIDKVEALADTLP